MEYNHPNEIEPKNADFPSRQLSGAVGRKSAVALFADKPFRVGDRIQLDSIDGTVEAIGLRGTRVRNLDGHLRAVPNRTMANASITNINKRPDIKTVMNVGVTYDTPAEKVAPIRLPTGVMGIRACAFGFRSVWPTARTWENCAQCCWQWLPTIPRQGS